MGYEVTVKFKSEQEREKMVVTFILTECKARPLERG